MPGVSTKTSCALSVVRMPSWRLRVVCGLDETAAIFCPNSAFTSVDLPTLGRPMIAIKAERYSVISGCYLFDTQILFSWLHVCDCQTRDNEYAAREDLPGKFLTEEEHAQQHATQRKEVGHHAGAGGSDLVEQVIRQHKGKTRPKDTQKEQCDPGDPQLRNFNRAFDQRRCQPHNGSCREQRSRAAQDARCVHGGSAGVDVAACVKGACQHYGKLSKHRAG